MATATKRKRYLVEAYYQDEGWTWGYIAVDGLKSSVTFRSEDEAETAIQDLRRLYREDGHPASREEFRIVEID